MQLDFFLAGSSPKYPLFENSNLKSEILLNFINLLENKRKYFH